MLVRSALYTIVALLFAVASGATIPFASQCQTISAGQLCYAINVPSTSNTSDLYISMSGPSSIGYSGLGFGSAMSGSLNFIALPTTSNVTLSVRTASSEVMPTTYTATTIGLEVLNGTTNNGSSWQANFRCTNCRTWSSGSLDVNSTSADMIWAAGALSSGAVSTNAAASIQNHGSNRGNFALNLLSATGSAGIPGSGTSTTELATAATTSTTTSSSGSSSSSSSRAAIWWSHAALMSVGWILIMGLGAILIRFFPSYFKNGVRAHYLLQSFGVLLVIIGTVLGIVGSGKHFHYAHQTLGVITFALMFVQVALGTVHHMLYKKGGGRSKFSLGVLHRYFGRALIVVAMVTAGLAFRMPMVALSKGSQIAWYVVLGFVVLVYTVANFVLTSPGKGRDASRAGDTTPNEKGRLSTTRSPNSA